MANTVENYKTEDQLQAACIMWFSQTYPAYRGTLFAVPNGGTRDARTANILKATGVVAGVSDLVWVVPTAVEFIEMKLPGKTQQDNQVEFEKKVRYLGHNYTVIFSLWTFKQFITSKIEYYYGKV